MKDSTSLSITRSKNLWLTMILVWLRLIHQLWRWRISWCLYVYLMPIRLWLKNVGLLVLVKLIKVRLLCLKITLIIFRILILINLANNDTSLQKLKDWVSDDKKCLDVDKYFNPTQQICIGGTAKGGTGACHGDSGSAFQCKGTDGRYYQVPFFQ